MTALSPVSGAIAAQMLSAPQTNAAVAAGASGESDSQASVIVQLSGAMKEQQASQAAVAHIDAAASDM